MAITDQEIKDFITLWIPYIKKRHGIKDAENVKIQIEGDPELINLFEQTKGVVLNTIKATEVEKTALQYKDELGNDIEVYDDDLVISDRGNKKILIRITR